MYFLYSAPFSYVLVFGAIPSLQRDGIAVRHHITFPLICYALKMISNYLGSMEIRVQSVKSVCE
jgi:hypothetical protein